MKFSALLLLCLGSLCGQDVLVGNFQVKDDGSLTKGRIFVGQRVGIGTASPGAELEIAANGVAEFLVTSSGATKISMLSGGAGLGTITATNAAGSLFNALQTAGFNSNIAYLVSGNKFMDGTTANAWDANLTICLDWPQCSGTSFATPFQIVRAGTIRVQATDGGAGGSGALTTYRSDGVTVVDALTPAGIATIGTVGVGTLSPGYPLDVAGGAGAQVHFNATATDTGSYLMNLSGTDTHISGGAAFNGSWVAKATTSGIAVFRGGGGANPGNSLELYANTGLTIGAAFAPTLRFVVDTSGSITTANNINASGGVFQKAGVSGISATVHTTTVGCTLTVSGGIITAATSC